MMSALQELIDTAQKLVDRASESEDFGSEFGQELLTRTNEAIKHARYLPVTFNGQEPMGAVHDAGFDTGRQLRVKVSNSLQETWHLPLLKRELQAHFVVSNPDPYKPSARGWLTLHTDGVRFRYSPDGDYIRTQIDFTGGV